MIPPGGAIGRYAVAGVLGAGAFATVYRARDERLDADVAVKVLAENHALDPDVRERFLAEGRVLRRVRSPHVVAVHDLGETSAGQPYLVLDLVAGGTLADRVAERRRGGWRPSAEDLAAVVLPLAEGVAALHRLGVVHRDLSPRNVLLQPAGGGALQGPGGGLLSPGEVPVLADLGLSKDLRAHSGLTAAGGTDGFRAPEQRAGPAVVTPAADVWGLSALAVWLLADRAPDAGPPGAGWAGAVAAVAPPLVGELDRGLSEDPTARHADAVAWATAVARALGEVGRPASSSPPPPSPSPAAPSAQPAAGSAWPAGRGGSLPRARRRSRVRALVAGVALVAAFGAGAAAVALPDRAEPAVVDALGSGRVEVRRASDGVVVAIRGPQTAEVGEAVTFAAAVQGAPSWVWVAPEGTAHLEAGGLQVTPSSPGVADVRLIALRPDGPPVEVVHRLVVEG